MKITICNSVKFWQEAKNAKEELDKLGHDVLTHPMEVDFRGKKVPVFEYYKARKEGWDDEIESMKEYFIREHLEKIKNSDAIVVLNIDKDGKKNYIGGNTLIEMGLAFFLRKKIFLFNQIPEELSYAEEIKGMKPIILNGDLSKVK